MEIKANVYFEDSTGRYEYDINVNDIVKLKNLVIGIKKRHFKTKFNFLISFVCALMFAITAKVKITASVRNCRICFFIFTPYVFS